MYNPKKKKPTVISIKKHEEALAELKGLASQAQTTAQKAKAREAVAKTEALKLRAELNTIQTERDTLKRIAKDKTVLACKHETVLNQQHYFFDWLADETGHEIQDIDQAKYAIQQIAKELGSLRCKLDSLFKRVPGTVTTVEEAKQAVHGLALEIAERREAEKHSIQNTALIIKELIKDVD